MRRAFDEDAPLPPHGKAPETGNWLPCSTCGEFTASATLSACGSRCVACFRRYCQAPLERSLAQSVLPDAIGRLAWARRLRECEMRGSLLPNGRRMTPFQRHAWRAALHESVQDNPDETLRQLDARQRSAENIAVLLMVEKGESR